MYLDNAATTPLTDSVKEYVISILDKFGRIVAKIEHSLLLI